MRLNTRAIAIGLGLAACATLVVGATAVAGDPHPASHPTHQAVVVQDNHVRLYARDGASLFIVRCSLDGTCRRAVTSSVRPGVTRIVVTQLPLPTS